MTAQPSREWLINSIKEIESIREEIPFGVDTDTAKTLAAFKLALAGMNSEPVEYPETLPCPVLLEPGMRFGKGVKTRLMLEAMHRRAEYYAELDAMTPKQRAEHDAVKQELKEMLSAPVTAPDDLKLLADIITHKLKANNTSARETQKLEYALALTLSVMADRNNQCRAAMHSTK
ncbi:hypothetical protein N4G41_03570 [Kosakonia sacchari]|uniref:hypothetical protein n=1 Tax=Kosakonia sacchari TaxID=1158459 RepID=UPI002ACD22EA|nr:hypothetical protein [Kosakonia sacchari]MDZ7320707.1 hypothetical protein [Kosakonia sacchari]